MGLTFSIYLHLALTLFIFFQQDYPNITRMHKKELHETVKLLDLMACPARFELATS